MVPLSQTPVKKNQEACMAEHGRETEPVVGTWRALGEAAVVLCASLIITKVVPAVFEDIKEKGKRKLATLTLETAADVRHFLDGQEGEGPIYRGARWLLLHARETKMSQAPPAGR